MKEHRTITLTREMLRDKLDACERGLDATESMLPLTLSTDPEDNIDVALTMVYRQEDNNDFASGIYWFFRRMAWSLPGDAAYQDLRGQAQALASDCWMEKEPQLLAQLLAEWAECWLRHYA